MNLTDIQGIPAHPLFVHIPVVLIPLIGVSSIAMIFWASLRSKIGWITVGLSFVSIAMIHFASDSGESLQERLPDNSLIDKHANLAEVMTSLGVVMFLVLTAFILFDRRASFANGQFALESLKPGQIKMISLILSALLAVSVVGTNVRLYQVGHSGATAVWHNTPDREKPSDNGNSGK